METLEGPGGGAQGLKGKVIANFSDGRFVLAYGGENIMFIPEQVVGRTARALAQAKSPEEAIARFKDSLKSEAARATFEAMWKESQRSGAKPEEFLRRLQEYERSFLANKIDFEEAFKPQAQAPQSITVDNPLLEFARFVKEEPVTGEKPAFETAADFEAYYRKHIPKELSGRLTSEDFEFLSSMDREKEPAGPTMRDGKAWYTPEAILDAALKLPHDAFLRVQDWVAGIIVFAREQFAKLPKWVQTAGKVSVSIAFAGLLAKEAGLLDFLASESLNAQSTSLGEVRIEAVAISSGPFVFQFRNQFGENSERTVEYTGETFQKDLTSIAQVYIEFTGKGKGFTEFQAWVEKQPAYKPEMAKGLESRFKIAEQSAKYSLDIMNETRLWYGKMEERLLKGRPADEQISEFHEKMSLEYHNLIEKVDALMYNEPPSLALQGGKGATEEGMDVEDPEQGHQDQQFEDANRLESLRLDHLQRLQGRFDLPAADEPEDAYNGRLSVPGKGFDFRDVECIFDKWCF